MPSPAQYPWDTKSLTSVSQVESLSHHDELRVPGPGALLEGHDGQLAQVDVLLVEEGLIR